MYEHPLSEEEMTRILTAIMRGESSRGEMRSFLSVLAKRGETAQEIAAAVRVLRAHAVQLPLSKSYELCDTCGTGGDAKGTINVSTLAALVAAAAGVRIAKHGNRAASSRCGSADLLEGLGVNLDATPAQVARCIEELGFGFCFAPKFHPAMKAVAQVRKELGIRTIFNLIGPLANPASLTFQLVGVSDERLLRPMAEALVRLGVRHCMVVHGRDGLDEVTTTHTTDVLEVRSGNISEWQIDPVRLGIRRSDLDELRGADVAENVSIAHQALEGRPSPVSDIVSVNAGCAIYVADRANSILDGIAKARAVLDSNQALRLLGRVQEMSHA